MCYINIKMKLRNWIFFKTKSSKKVINWSNKYPVQFFGKINYKIALNIKKQVLTVSNKQNNRNTW